MKIQEVTFTPPPMPDINGIAPGQTKELGDGQRLTVNSNGTVSYSGGFGTVTYDQSGKYLNYRSPNFAGLSKTQNADGSEVTDYNSGPMSVSQKVDAKGQPIKTSAEYNLGIGKLGAEKDFKTGIRTMTATPTDPDADPNELLPTSAIASAKGVDPKKFAAFQKQNPSAVREQDISTLLKLSGLK